MRLCESCVRLCEVVVRVRGLWEYCVRLWEV